MGQAAVSTTPSAWLATYLKNFEVRGPGCEPQEVGSEGVPPGQSASVVQGLPAFGPSTQTFTGQPAPAQSSGVIARPRHVVAGRERPRHAAGGGATIRTRGLGGLA